MFYSYSCFVIKIYIQCVNILGAGGIQCKVDISVILHGFLLRFYI